MTRDEILAMEPGWELDALVDDVVMGMETYDHTGKKVPYYEKRYSTDISVAWEVVDHLKHYHFELVRHEGIWTAAFDDGKKSYYHRSNTESEAICKAALLAILAESEVRLNENPRPTPDAPSEKGDRGGEAQPG
jgi:predicted restriction endonuclease